jgi:hypothetical protein
VPFLSEATSDYSTQERQMANLVSSCSGCGRAGGAPAGLTHLAAFGGTTPARRSTILAMLDLILAAFFPAQVADFGTGHANRDGSFTISCHEPGRDTAKLCAVDIQRNTPRHHFDILLAQAGGRAQIACVGAVVTGFDA